MTHAKTRAWYEEHLGKKGQIFLPHEILIAEGAGLRTSVREG